MIQTHKVKIDDLTVNYHTIGNPNKQIIVFVHGWPMGLVMIKKINILSLFKELARHFYVIVPEHPGFFRSDPPKSMWGMNEYANYLHKFINKLKLKKPIIMGKSFGGAVAATYAILYPTNIRTLILVDAATRKRKEQFWYKFVLPPTLITTWFISSKFSPMFLKKIVISRFLNVPKDFIKENTFRKYLIMSKIFIEYRIDVDYKKLQVPLILVWGDNDAITPIEEAKRIHKKVKNSKLLVFHGGHLVMEKNPKEVIDSIVKNLT